MLLSFYYLYLVLIVLSTIPLHSTQESTAEPSVLPSSFPSATLKNSFWYRITIGQPQDLYLGATWLNSWECIVVGRQGSTSGVLLYSVNRGATWSRVSANFTSNMLTDVASFTSTLTGNKYVLATSFRYGIIYRAMNDWSSWVSAIRTNVQLYGMAIGMNGNDLLHRNKYIV